MALFRTIASSHDDGVPEWALLRLGHNHANAVLFVTDICPVSRQADYAIDWRFQYLVPTSLTHLPYSVLDKHVRHIVGRFISSRLSLS